MAVEVVADDNYAVFVQTTSGEAFGPAINAAGADEAINRDIAEQVLSEANEPLARLWAEDRGRVWELVALAKQSVLPHRERRGGKA